MAMIHIYRDGQSLGVDPEEDVREGLRVGRFAPTDLGWREGMAAWQPLSQFPEFAGVEARGAAPQPSAPPIAVTPVAPGPPPEPIRPREGLPWEQRQARGFVNAFFETLVMVLTRPGTAFMAMKREGGLLEPLLYAIIGGSFGVIVYFL